MAIAKFILEKGVFMANLTVATVNVNGLRAAVKKGMGKWFESQREKGLDVLCLQETKISESKDKEDFIRICKELDIKKLHLQEDKYSPKPHAGVAVWINPEIRLVKPVKCPFEENEAEAKGLGFSGRWQEITLEIANKKIVIVNSYYHRADEEEKETMHKKHKFFAKTTQRMRYLLKEPNDGFILVGDINTAHHNIDIDTSDDSKTKKKAGFLPEERAWLDLWFASENDKTAIDRYKENLKIGYTPPPQLTVQFAEGGLELHDVVREYYEKDTKIYTWWSSRPTPKVIPTYPFDRNVGWRIDYQIASKNMAKSVKEVNIPREEFSGIYERRWSDHAPVVVTYSI